ncbi:MAG: inosine 5'-monophosphate dehydrogenase [Methanosaeta sp. PtaB.Bin018]|jgi:CBS domain-containing protein|nr:MAG: inosine 5'-monophosphate dehydrogenase [Methanosaeta sp. PtaB.Bin018]OPY43411.1 MAG: inosine 5'-monophosphate dehydrogenase [Methanosaeta sp. PtaU1.Bin016]
MKVRDLMSYPIVTVRPESHVLEAIRRMADERKGCVLVARDGLLKECLGILTTSQIFQKVFASGLDPANVEVSEVMTPAPLITIDLNASSQEAAALMLKHDIRRLPVVKNGTLVGIITSKDLLKCVH